MEYCEKSRSKEQEISTKFNQLVYSEIEEIGWDNLVRLSEDLRFLSFRIPDKKGRTHILEIQLDKTYPKSPPSISANVPYIHDLEWSPQFKLENVVRQFREHLERLQEFWSTFEDIENHLFVDQNLSSSSSRCIKFGNDCFVILSVNTDDPKYLPEIRFIGSGEFVDMMRKKWGRNSGEWSRERPFVENLELILETELPRPAEAQKEEQVECGICYAQRLPIEEEFGEKGGGETDYACENANCKMAFHSLCLVEWLRSITTTRQSFNVLFGNCPYCSDPIAVKINNADQ